MAVPLMARRALLAAVGLGALAILDERLEARVCGLMTIRSIRGPIVYAVGLALRRSTRLAQLLDMAIAIDCARGHVVDREVGLRGRGWRLRLLRGCGAAFRDVHDQLVGGLLLLGGVHHVKVFVCLETER